MSLSFVLLTVPLPTLLAQSEAPGDPTIVRSRTIEWDSDVFARAGAGQRIALHLFDDVSVIIVLDRVDHRAQDRLTLIGHVDGRPNTEVLIVVNGDVVAGVIRMPPVATYRIRFGGAGRLRIMEVDETREPPCGGSQNPAPPSAPGGGAALGGNCDDDGSVIDVLVLYTPLARDGAGGTAAIEAEIDLAAAVANEAYQNSQIGTRLNLVHVAETSYDESGSYGDHLVRLTSPNDGIMDEAHALRERYGADMVGLFVADGEYCGVAWLMDDLSNDFERWAFSVTTWYCDLTFAHELGHNMGACHAVGDGGGCNGGGLYPYSNGHRFIGDGGTQWRTVMAYSPGNGIAHFSNPDVDFDGQPTGIPEGQEGEADNARTINESAYTVANFRCHVRACEAGTARYVDGSAPSGGDGSDWDAAYKHLQDALEYAAQPANGVSELWVAAGAYKPDQGATQKPGDRAATFQLISCVTIYGGFPPGGGPFESRDPATHETILSGDLDGNDGPRFANNDENSYHVVTASGTGPAAVLDGFTVTGGNANAEDGPNCDGAGVYNVGGAPTIRNCVITANHTDPQGDGGGMFNGGAGATPLVVECEFRDNQSGWGGGMYNEDGSAPIVIGSSFINNFAFSNGGGMLNYNRSSPTISQCFFGGNNARAGGGMANGTHSNPQIDNSVFVGCRAGTKGGAISNYLLSNPSITNCTIVANSAGISVGGIISWDDSVANVVNSIVWDNLDPGGGGETAQVWIVGEGIVGVAYCCIMGWTGTYEGEGNIDDDPLFVDPDGLDDDPDTWEDNDHRLGSGSPGIDAADNRAVPDGVTLDLDGLPRFVDDPETQDTGRDDPPIVDMGAYEFQVDAGGCTRDPEWMCDGDVDGDGQVNPVDSGLVQARFGSVEELDLCNYDVDCDGQINPVDSGIVQSLFGTCEEPRGACP